jgi:hypothetical protein
MTVREERPSSLGRTLLKTPAVALVLLLMAVGSVLLWLAIPVGWVWIASQIVNSSQPTFGPYLLILVAVPVSMYLAGKALFRLDGVYARLTGRDTEVRVQLPWHKSMRGERESGRKPTVLEAVMIVSVSVALLSFAIWFFVFAGSSIPGSGGG